jgi:hypothetical protein
MGSGLETSAKVCLNAAVGVFRTLGCLALRLCSRGRTQQCNMLTEFEFSVSSGHAPYPQVFGLDHSTDDGRKGNFYIVFLA